MPTNWPTSADNLGQVPSAPFFQSQTVNGRTHRAIINALMAWADAMQAKLGLGWAGTPTEGKVPMGSATSGQADWVLAPKLLYAETVSVAKAAISIPSIPQLYTSLRLDILARSDAATNATQVYLRFNNDAGNTYDYVVVYSLSGVMSTVEAITTSLGRVGLATAATSPANDFGATSVSIPFYRAATHKRATARSFMRYATGAGGTMEEVDGCGWRPTTPTPITSIQLVLGGGNFVAGTQVALWGDP